MWRNLDSMLQCMLSFFNPVMTVMLKPLIIGSQTQWRCRPQCFIRMLMSDGMSLSGPSGVQLVVLFTFVALAANVWDDCHEPSTLLHHIFMFSCPDDGIAITSLQYLPTFCFLLWVICLRILLFESAHKTYKMTCGPAKTQISLNIRPVWSVFAVRKKKAWVLGYTISAKRRLIRLGGCTGWSESPLGAHAILFVMSCAGSNFIYTNFEPRVKIWYL